MAVRFITSDVYNLAGYPASHPLAIPRLSPVMALCEHLGWLGADAVIDSPQASREELAAFHDPAYLDALWTAEATGSVTPVQRLRHNIGTMENPVFPGLFHRASLTVGGSVLAARHAAQGRIAFHPAGGTHHGRPDQASGFCYFNDPVFAIRTLLDLGVDLHPEVTRVGAQFSLRSDPCDTFPLAAGSRGYWSDRHGIFEYYSALGIAGASVHSGDRAADEVVAQYHSQVFAVWGG